MKKTNREACNICRIRFGLEPKDHSWKPRILWKAQPEPKVLVNIRDLGYLVLGAAAHSHMVDTSLKEKIYFAAMKHHLILDEIATAMPELKLFF